MKVPYNHVIRFSASWGILLLLIYISSLISIPISKLMETERSEEFEMKNPKEAWGIFKEALNKYYREVLIKKKCKESGKECIYGYKKICWPEGCTIAKSFDDA